MKTWKQMINEVAQPVSPADKEFVALHPVTKKQFVQYPEHQFKGGTKKDHTKLAEPAAGPMKDEAEAEKAKSLGEETLKKGASAETAHAALMRAEKHPKHSEKWHAATAEYHVHKAASAPGNEHDAIKFHNHMADHHFQKAHEAHRKNIGAVDEAVLDEGSPPDGNPPKFKERDHGMGYHAVPHDRDRGEGSIIYAHMSTEAMKHHGLSHNKGDGQYGHTHAIKDGRSGHIHHVYQRDYDGHAKVHHVSVRPTENSESAFESARHLAHHLSNVDITGKPLDKFKV